ncbi:hypothetical protein Goklo_020813 [Gossypium klotzschianum]|uniref:Uncharacterized protein n=1 Tax=Gossypium klotzschianum TaxID=34286 RepID=A0A7J8UT56_9ROSI|nr:hypothetical protein [Gossypium klotzschianum]
MPWFRIAISTVGGGEE